MDRIIKVIKDKGLYESFVTIVEGNGESSKTLLESFVSLTLIADADLRDVWVECIHKMGIDALYDVLHKDVIARTNQKPDGTFEQSVDDYATKKIAERLSKDTQETIDKIDNRKGF